MWRLRSGDPRCRTGWGGRAVLLRTQRARRHCVAACNGHMSIQRAADLMGVLLDAHVSTGFTGGLVARLANTLTRFEAELKDALRAAPVMHHDETPARVTGDEDDDRLLYVYTARAGKLVWFGAADNRGHDALDAFTILPGYRGRLVRDDYPAYAKYNKDLTAVQLCNALAGKPWLPQTA